MSGRIPESFIEELVNRIDIVDVIEPRVPLKRAGNEFKACCPFHDEKTPSFTVSPKKQFFHCFGCGAHGTAIGFLMQYDGLEFVDAVEDLARQAGLEVPREAGFRPARDQSLYDLMAEAATYYQARLKESPEAIDYLKRRGVSGEIARDFGLGYALERWDGLLKRLGGSPETEQKLLSTGLLSRGDRGLYDKFRQRIMFPIHDKRGRVIAFGGRALADRGPKYLNSPETELFHKGRELYGLYLARQHTGDDPRLIVVEGYMDVVALAQFGIRNAVATLGTATTMEHAEMLFRSVPEVVYCFDGDRAGRQAAWRALDATLPKMRDGRQAKFLFLPEGEDPDSMVRQEGADAFRRRVDQATPLSAFFFQQLSAQTDVQSLEGRARLAELARPYLEKMPSGVLRELMHDDLQRRVTHAVSLKRAPTAAKTPTVRGQRTNVRTAIAHLLQNPQLASKVPDLPELAEKALPGLDLLAQLLEFCRTRPQVSTAGLLEHWRDHDLGAHLGVLAASELRLNESNEEAFWRDTLNRIAQEVVEKQIGELEETQRQRLLTDDGKQSLSRLLKRRTELEDKHAEN